MTTKKLAALLCALAAAVGCGAVQADAVFSDSDFNTADYTSSTFSSGTVSPTTIAQTATGNPGNALQTSFTASGPFSARVGVIRNSFTYDPTISGAITSIDVSIDRIGTRTLNGLANPFLTLLLRPLIFQDGNYYQAESVPFGAVNGDNVSIWVTLVMSGLTAADFGLYDFATGTLNTALHPNFSAGMTFGFVSVSAFALAGTIGTTVAETRNDNWVLTIHTVPEPGSLALLGLGLAGLAAARSRKRQ